MHLKITEEPSKGKGDAATIFYLREMPHVPGMTIQATALSLEGAKWLASRFDNVTKLEIPKNS